jgi:ribosome-binding protein aMBF1 (putative translation factor)
MVAVGARLRPDALCGNQGAGDRRKAVALKAAIRRKLAGEKDSQRAASKRPGQKKCQFRATRGLSQEALAHECGINRTYLSGVERSERNVSIDNIARIARGLKVKASVLLDDGK